jgi:short-subunit dehydrogenase involved in D-alanine esterification of teichoic acids
VAVPEDREALLDSATAWAGPVDVLVNNAALSGPHDYTNAFTLGADRARPEIEVNLVAPIDLTRLFLAQRATRGGGEVTIAMVGTPGALFPLDASPLYSTTKAGLHMFTLALRRQLRDDPTVKVLEIFPPALDTRLTTGLDVPAQAANGEDAIRECGRRCLEGILAGDEVILPDAGAAAAYAALVPDLDEAWIDMVNRGVQRQPGWDRPGV